MSSHPSKQKLKLLPYDAERLKVLFGVCHEHLNTIETALHVEIMPKENHILVTGKENQVKLACTVLRECYEMTDKPDKLNPKHIETLIDSQLKAQSNQQHNPASTVIQLPDRQVFLQNKQQIQYIENIKQHTVSFAYGPAGTGKTFLAVAAAVDALYQHEIKKIILVRPAVNAGESIGFLPGDIYEKFNPYLQPFYDSLHALMPSDKRKKLLGDNTIEIAPLAFMRGRTLANAFIILDEGQNTTIEQMKMMLTRIGQNSKLCITGDPSQVDLPRSQTSGLSHAHRILASVDDISHTIFDHHHVVRHRLIQEIIQAYERDEH